MGHFHFCHFLPLFAGLNRLKPASGKKHFLPAEMPTLVSVSLSGTHHSQVVCVTEFLGVSRPLPLCVSSDSNRLLCCGALKPTSPSSDSNRSVHSWEPLIAAHRHRSDALVYSVQRSPAYLDITEYEVELVWCRDPRCRQHQAIQGTRRVVTVRPGTRRGGGGGGCVIRQGVVDLKANRLLIES